MDTRRACCCGNPRTPCDCSSLSAVTVTWDGSITFSGSCEDPCGGSGTGYVSMPTTTITDLAIVCTRVEGTGKCSYVGTFSQEVTQTLCEDGSVTPTLRIEATAEVVWVGFSSRWYATMVMRMLVNGTNCASFGDCSYASSTTSGLGEWRQTSESPNGNDCPDLATYTSIETCDPDINVFGCSLACDTVTAFASGDLTVS
jgi:hypothetical protein